MDLAEIGFKADTSDLKKAEKALEDLAPAAEKVEKAVDDVAKSTDRARDAKGRFIPKVKQTESSLKRLAAGNGLVSKTFRNLTTGVNNLLSGFRGLASGIISAFAVTSAINGASELSGSIAELSTLLPGATSELNIMTDAAREFADSFNTNQASQISSFYGAVSAGATDAASAIKIVDAANRLAIGGVTDVATGVDILTTSTNAYAAEGLQAADASDILFTAMRAGKTTVGELSSTLGNVIPIAASLGIGLDELAAGTAALTLQGLSTASSVTSLRAVLTGVAKPTAEASKLAEQLGIDFSTTALRTKGLAGFLEDVVEQTDGSADALSVMFGSVEALNAALAFAGAGGESFNEILGQMSERAGATDQAVQVVTESLNFRWNSLITSLQNTAVDFGTALLEIIVPIGEGFRNLVNGTSELTPVFKALGVAIIAVASTQLPALIISIASYVSGISLAAVATGVFTTAVTAARLALIALGGPIGILFGVIGAVAAGMLTFGENTKIAEAAAYDAEAGTMALNNQLNLFKSTEAPQAARAAIDVANANFELANSAFEAAKAELVKRRALVETARAGANNPIAGGASFFKALANEADAIDALTKAENDLKTAQSERRTAIQITNDSLRQQTLDLVNGNEKVVTTSERVTTAISNIRNPLDKVATSADKVATSTNFATQELTELQLISQGLNEISEPFNQASSAISAAQTALENGILTNDEYANSLSRIQEAFAMAGGSAEQWKTVLENSNQTTDKFSDDIKALGDRTISGLSSSFADLAVSGSANFEDLAKSIVRSLIEIAIQALITQAITAAFGGGFADGGAPSGGIQGFEPSALFADGGSFDNGVQKFASGGTFTNSIVTKPTLFSFANGSAFGEMGEAGPEAIMPLERGPDGSLGVQMFGGGGLSKPPMNNNVEINNNYMIEGAVSSEEITQQIMNAGETTKEDVRQSVVGWLDTYDRDGTL